MSRAVRIMVVEDNAADVLLLKETLRHLGISFSLEHYENGEDAANTIAAMTDPPDLILLDINVPRVNGLELLSLIRARAMTARPTVAIFTSSRAASDQKEAERLGADDYIVKPMGYHEFLSGVGGSIQRLLAKGADHPAGRLVPIFSPLFLYCFLRHSQQCTLHPRLRAARLVCERRSHAKTNRSAPHR